MKGIMCRGVANAVGAPRAAPSVPCRICIDHATIAIAKIGIVTLELSEAAA